MKTQHLLPIHYLFISLVMMILLHILVPVSTIAVYPWTLLGTIPLIIGIMLNLSADAAFKTARTTVKPFELTTVLITAGVFKLTRHPMYLGMVLILCGIAVLLASLTPFIIVIVFAILIERVFVRTEEKMLAQQFGTAWDAYTERVKKWL